LKCRVLTPEMGSRLKTKQKMLISFIFFVRKTKSFVPNFFWKKIPFQVFN
jgi:hypothetical protein